MASGCTAALGLAHDEPKGAGRGQGAQEGGSGTTAFVSYCRKALGHPLIDWMWAGAELAWCTPPHCHRVWPQPPKQCGRWGLPMDPWLGNQELLRFICSPVPCCASTRALGEPGSPSLEQIQGNSLSPWRGRTGRGVAGGIRAKGTAGHSQLGTGTQMVLPESCSSDQRVKEQEKRIAGRKTVQMTEKSPCSGPARKKGKKPRNTPRNTGQVQHSPGTLGLSE